ncbi:hypothetical protein JN535_11440 [Cellulosimicrobium cellulans]|uniref:Uncharacterized protein n=1 Tax=Cellulosimicrobium cellulans TaxID=1710 RepID=A0A1Y0HVJ2_CELCE|nr:MULTISPECIES: hypothetical protein [Cellulosimicrobium]ARU51284.1 hypothetical protein CBR64_07065 [Cellulosimicrobium cellulans]MBN0040777.1 hypothetical protein [Cellulosimicrobium cellulans]GED08129.1 hypothetical protein CCE02nite_01280 [Cellulosimicrobium cellulans]
MYATPTRPMTQDELDRICRVWADCGSDDPTDRWLELWDGGDADDHPEQRDAIVAIAREVGLEAAVEDGVLRVQKTQQLHDEIGARWI